MKINKYTGLADSAPLTSKMASVKWKRTNSESSGYSRVVGTQFSAKVCIWG